MTAQKAAGEYAEARISYRATMQGCATWELRMMVRALSGLELLNDEDEAARLDAARDVLAQRRGE